MDGASLTIDTSDSKETKVALSHDGTSVAQTMTKEGRSQTVIPAVEELLDSSGEALADIRSVTVNTGPGSFTGLRVGAAVGSVIGWLFSVSVNGKPAGEPVDLVYGEDRWA